MDVLCNCKILHYHDILVLVRQGGVRVMVIRVIIKVLLGVRYYQNYRNQCS